MEKPKINTTITAIDEQFSIGQKETAFTVKIDYKSKFAFATFPSIRIDNLTIEQVNAFVEDIYTAYDIAKESLKLTPQQLAEAKYKGC